MSDNAKPRKSRFGWLFTLWVIGPLLVLAIGVVALIRNPPQPLLLSVLAKQFRQHTGYGITFGAGSSIVLWPEAKADLRDVKIRRPTLTRSRGGVVADADRVTAELSLEDWLAGDRTIQAIAVEKPTITVFRSDFRQLQAGSGAGTGGVKLRRIDVKNGFLSYHERAASPEFSFSKIEATVTDVGAGRIGGLESRFEWREALVRLTGAMARSGDKQSDLTFRLKGPTTQVDFKGTAFDDATTRVEGDAKMHVSSIDGLMRWLNIDHGPELRALTGSGTISGPVALSSRQVWLKGADVKTAIAEGKVDVAIDLRNERPKITGEAAWQRLDLNAFTTPRPKLTALAVTRRVVKAEPAVTIDSAWQDLDAYLDTLGAPRSALASVRSAAPPPPAKSPLSPITLNFDAFKLGDMALLQTADTLLVGGWEIKDVALDSRLDAGQLSLDVSQAAFASGQWQGKLAIDGRSATPEHTLALTGTRVDVKELLDKTVGPATLEGRSTFKADLSARGTNLDAVIRSLSGKANIDLDKGRLIGFDLRAVLNRWWRKWSYDRRRTTPFDTLRARVRVNRGVVKTIGPATLRGNHVEVDTNGTVSLARQLLDQRVRARLAPPPSQLPIPVRISGLWSKPIIKLDFSLFGLQPNRYAMPFKIDPIIESTTGTRSSRSLAPSAGQAMPEALRVKLREALGDPATAQNMPEKLRRSLAPFVRE